MKREITIEIEHKNNKITKKESSVKPTKGLKTLKPVRTASNTSIELKSKYNTIKLAKNLDRIRSILLTGYDKIVFISPFENFPAMLLAKRKPVKNIEIRVYPDKLSPT